MEKGPRPENPEEMLSDATKNELAEIADKVLQSIKAAAKTELGETATVDKCLAKLMETGPELSPLHRDYLKHYLGRKLLRDE